VTRQRRLKSTLGLVVAPLLLALGACGGSGDAEKTSGEPIEKIAPPEGQAWSEIVEKTEDGGYRMGNPDAPIKLVEFASLTCPHCKHFTEEGGEELRDTFVASGRVSWEFRNFIMNPLDLTMAMLVRCGSPESFFALTEQTFTNQQNLVEAWSANSEATLEAASSQPPATRYIALAGLAGLPEFYGARGIAVDQAKACLGDSATAEALVEATRQQSEKYDITGTPSFLINGQNPEANTWPEIKTRLENLGAR